MLSSKILQKSLISFRECRNIVRTITNSELNSSKVNCKSNNKKLIEQKEGNRKMKYILVTGGVISGVGKGVIASSFGTLLNCNGISVTSLKIDPYINIDAGTFSPYEHGKLFFSQLFLLRKCAKKFLYITKVIFKHNSFSRLYIS